MKFNHKIASLIIPAVIASSSSFLPVESVKADVVPLNTQSQVSKASESPVFFILKYALLFGGVSGTLLILISFFFRKVVNTNMVHIVQNGKTTVPYGSNLPNGNVYYEIPSWVPKFGVSVIKLPVNNFDLSLQDYEAYDEDRVPFLVDVTAFFRIIDPTVASQRISNISSLEQQLTLIVQGAVRRVLASEKIDNIMTQRSTFGESFSNEVRDQLAEWGVSSVRNMELMDIRDSPKSSVISNIMAKKISEIEKDSRITVAENNRLATVAEVENKRTSEISSVEANREIALSKQLAEQQVGERSAEKDKVIGIAQEQSKQQVLLQQAETKEKDLAVQRVQEIKSAEITRDRALVQAEELQKVAKISKETALIEASQQKETSILIADGKLESEKRNAEAIQTTGIAKAEADKAMQLAPVSAQIALSQEIGNNESYQKYLVLVEALKSYMSVGVEQAKALQSAEVKVIANGGSTSDGVKNVMDLFSSKGGTSLASAFEAFAQSDLGADLLNKITQS